MTDQPATPLHSIVDHTAERRRTITYSFVLVAIAVISTAWVGAIVNREREQAANRADHALVALTQVCEQVQRLGAQCAVNPEQVARDTGLAGPAGLPGADGVPGRPPTQAEIAAEVAAYLRAHPPPAGPQGDTGPAGAPGEDAPGTACPGHWVSYTIRLANGGQSIKAFLCIP